MRIFVTGATGFIGSALVPELIKAGHTVLGLTRSEASGAALRALGAEVQLGSLEDLASLREGANQSDAVIHMAFDTDYSNFEKSSEDDRNVVAALGETLKGSDRPLLISSVIAAAASADHNPATENSPLSPWNPRTRTEVMARDLAELGVNTSVLRMGIAHNTHKQAFVSFCVQAAKATGRAAYIGDGSTRWSAAHMSDVARLYRLALEKVERGSVYHAVDEEGVTMRAIAEALGRRLSIPVASISPEEAETHFGWLAMFMTLDLPASSAITRERLGWQPTGPGLIADLDAME